MKPDLIVRGQCVILPSGMAPAAIYIHGGRILSVEDYDITVPGVETLDAGDYFVMPGIVDTHVHLNDPGREDWEGFVTGTRAAAAGGVTTVVDMPLNSVPATTTVEGLRAKIAAATGRCSVDVGFWGGVVPGNTAQIDPLIFEGVLGFKCFLVPSGVDEFPNVDEVDLRSALPRIAAQGSVLLVHAEAPGPIEQAHPDGPSSSYATYLASRPPESEQQAIDLMIRLCGEFGARIHIVHLATAAAVPALQRARESGLPITVETCPHYLYFEAEKIPDGATEFKCAPPIRDAANREGLWEALRNGVIDLIATDHSPCPPEMKTGAGGDFFRAWGGIASLQFGLAAVWWQARRRWIAIEDVSDWMSANPARLAGLTGRKGAIIPGADADLIFFDPRAPIDWNRPIEHRHKLTPYAGQPLDGVVRRTILRGKTIFHDGNYAAPQGELIFSALHRLNNATIEEATHDLLRCCGSPHWAGLMASQRPFVSVREFLETADAVARQLSDGDWLAAFAAHPKIGDRQGSTWSKQEQSSVGSAGSATRDELQRLNDTYFERFGFIFIICATGKSASEMLDALRQRIQNTREVELLQAAAEQRLITQLRLRKLLGQ